VNHHIRTLYKYSSSSVSQLLVHLVGFPPLVSLIKYFYRNTLLQ